MMKNNRPYSIENGWEDADLITDHPQAEIDLVMDWIRENIVPRKVSLAGTDELWHQAYPGTRYRAVSYKQ